MGVLTLSRRRFLEASAVAGGAAVLSAATASSALAESNVESGGSNDVKRVRSCCRACGKMECGVWVTVQNGRAIRVEGDESAFQSMGNCCNKSQSSIQAAYHPDRLYHPMKRTNPKDNDDPGWVRISWEEAFSTITQKLEETARSTRGCPCSACRARPASGHARLRRLGPAGRFSQHGDPVAGVQRPAFLRHVAELVRCLFLAGERVASEGLRFLGHGAGVLELR